MHIDYSATLISLKTIPEQDGKQDICKQVVWEIKFFETTYPDQVWSVASIDTILDTDTLSDSFVEFADLTQQKILQMALDHQGGDSFLDQLMEIHEPYLLSKYALRDTEEKAIADIQEQ